MKLTSSMQGWVRGLMLAALLAAGSALADKPVGAGGPKADHPRVHKEKHGPARQAGDQGSIRVELTFGERQRAVVRDYFARQVGAGRCPPGLARKGNACSAPGQARKWVVGRPLPRDVIFYELPPAVVVELGPPPAGHRYVRVAADILLIAVGTSMVIDAIEDLGGL